ncbi:MAG: glycosyltransferase [Patescibacteria group bacterium]|nr:glycosyltransferase [Patescibacteria group bacterium]
MKLTISVIIPTYNEEKGLEHMLIALKKAVPAGTQIIVTDDKSTDGTVAIARKYADAVLVPETKHPTIAANRNAGAKVANSDFLLFIDADCYIADPANFFAKAMKHFDADPNLLALTSLIKVTPESETLSDKIAYLMFNAVRLFKNNLSKVGEASGEFQLVKKSAFDRINGFREDLVTREDSDLFWRLSRIGRTYCDRNMVVYQTGRRGHAVGWIKLLSVWVLNAFWVMFFNKSFTNEWKAVR